MLTKVRLRRIESNHDNLRTSETVGYLHSVLEVGQPIVVTAEPLNKAFDVRCICTTEIEAILDNRYYTRNSVYEIEAIP